MHITLTSLTHLIWYITLHMKRTCSWYKSQSSAVLFAGECDCFVARFFIFHTVYKEVNVWRDAGGCDYSDNGVCVKRCKCNIVVSWIDWVMSQRGHHQVYLSTPNSKMFSAAFSIVIRLSCNKIWRLYISGSVTRTLRKTILMQPSLLPSGWM